MNVKDIITQDFLMFKKLHVLKDAEAKVTYHFIYGKIVLATQLNLLAIDDANTYIDMLIAIYNTLEP